MNAIFVVVYNRIKNIELWVKAWNKTSYHGNIPFTIVHNHDERSKEFAEQLVKIATDNKMAYWQHDNTGMDIGAFKKTIESATNVNNFFWFTDDYLPMKKNFLDPFIERLTDNVGLVAACYEPENESNKHAHVRTVGFAIKNEVAKKLVFPADMNSLRDCYEFEHGSNNMLKQIIHLGYDYRMAVGNNYPQPGYHHWSNASDWMWDCNHLKDLNLWEKFNEEFA